MRDSTNPTNVPDPGQQAGILSGQATEAGSLSHTPPAAVEAEEAAGVREIAQATETMRGSEERLRLATSAANLGLWDYDIQSDQLVWSDIHKALYGLEKSERVTLPVFLGCVDPRDRALLDASMRRLRDQPGSRIDLEFRVLRKNDGAPRWMKMTGAPLPDPPPGQGRYIGITLDITESKLAEQRLREASQHDQLTGLPGRGLLFEYCSHLLAMAKRTRSSGAVLFIDLDLFKPVNDTHGHAVGDQVMQQVAQRLVRCVRKEDLVGRLGGDEFVVAIPHPDDKYGPATVAQNIIESLSRPFHVGNLQLHLSASVGISLYPRHGSDLDSLISAADKAMYMAKQSGRGRYRFFSPIADEGSANEDVRIENLLRDALLHHGLEVHYQPVIEMQGGMTVGAEALLRLRDDDRIVSPEVFLPVAEATGLINRVGEWVLLEVCRQHRRWRQSGLDPLSVSVNIAPQQFRQRSFVAQLKQSLVENEMDPACLTIELKESTVLEDVSTAVTALKQVRDLGVKVALDDFGLGFSSIGLLSALPVDKLKIDQSFVGSLVLDLKARTIADSVLALGKTLNLQVIGEGIESADVFFWLQQHGCNQAQGYYFSKPLTAPEFEQWCQHERSQAGSVH